MLITNKKYPMYSPLFWSAYIVQMRPYLLFVSGIAGVAGMAMSKTATTETWKLILGFFPFFMGYGFGQALYKGPAKVMFLFT